MSDLSVVALALAFVIVVVTVCVTARPSAATGMTSALYALAAVITALWSWSRKP